MISVQREAPFCAGPPVSVREIGATVEAMLLELGLEDAGVNVALYGDAAMERLYGAFLGCAGPTNVLSFPSEEDDAGGELVLSLETAAREAFLYGQDLEEHVWRLLAHGVLHLAGFDHGPAMDAMTESLMSKRA